MAIAEVKVRFFARLHEIIGEKEKSVMIREGDSVRTVLATLSKQYGEKFDKYMYGKDGGIADHLQILLNGTNTANLEGLETKIDEGARIDIVPLVAGG